MSSVQSWVRSLPSHDLVHVPPPRRSLSSFLFLFFVCFPASQTDDIVSAIAMVSEHTCVSFHNRTSETNYLLFKTSKGYGNLFSIE